MNRFVISLGDFASAMGSVTRTYSRGLLSIAVLIGLILPSLVLLHALDSLKAAARDRSIEAVTDLLQDDLKLADCTFDARTQLGMMIRRFQMEHPPRMAPASGSRQDLVNNARKIFHLVRQMIPETTGYCLSHESVPESFGLEPETGSGTRLLFGTGMAQRVTKSDVTRLFSVMKRCLYGYPNLSLDLEAWRKGSLGSVWGFFQERKLKDAFMKTCGEFLPISIGGKPRLFLWEPVLKGAALTDPMPPVAHVPPKEFFRQASRNLLGGLMFVVDSRALMSRELEVTARALRWNLARMGCRLALLPSGASPGSAHARRAWRHPEYRTDPDLRRAAEEEKNEGIRIAGNWVILEGSLEKGDGFRILVGRPISGAFGRPSVWEISSQVGIALWFSIGFVVWGQLVIIGQPISVSLRRQLVLAFSYILLPALGLGTAILEKHLLEKRTRLESDLRNWAERRLESFDEGLQLYRSWGCRFLHDMLANEPFLERIRNIEASGAPPPASGPYRLLSDIHREAYRRGIHTRNILITGRRNFQMRYCPFEKGDENRGRNAENIGNFFRTLFQDTLNRLEMRKRSSQPQPQSQSQPPPQLLSKPKAMTGRNTAEMVDGAKAEMALSLVRALLPAEKLSEVCLSPLGFNDLSEGTIPSVFYHFLLGYPENPSYVLQVDVTPALFERSHLNEWEASRDEPGWGKLRILLSTAESPRFFLNYPFMETRTHPGYWDFGRILGFHSPLISGLSMRTTLLNSFCWEKIGEGKSAFLAVALPGKGFQSRVITGFLPIGSFIDEEIGFSMRVRGILFSLFWLNIALAVLVAVRIETPVARLGAAAQWVMRGNFSKRLEEHRGDEFGQLAVAFNNMLDLVGQGKLLNRFVSDSARDSVRAFVSGDLEAGAPISIEAVIMFAGPAGFKERLHLASPTEVIADLNLLLETIARAVRANGGEVNKFIGEKVLAVFALTGPAGRPDAAAFATAAAEEICERVGKLLPWRNTAMGVGLVLGPAISGNLGTDRVRLERTVIGDTVNLASRLCDIALGSRGGGIILDSALEAELRFQGNLSINARTRRLPALRVKGKQRSVGAFRLDL